jgi:hypothetical protein
MRCVLNGRIHNTIYAPDNVLSREANAERLAYWAGFAPEKPYTMVQITLRHNWLPYIFWYTYCVRLTLVQRKRYKALIQLEQRSRQQATPEQQWLVAARSNKKALYIN